MHQPRGLISKIKKYFEIKIKYCAKDNLIIFYMQIFLAEKSYFNISGTCTLPVGCMTLWGRLAGKA